RLKIDATSAEEGYADLQRAIDRKPDPSPEGLRTVQRLMKIRSPKVGEIKVEDVVDNRIIRKLDESGFIDRAYAAQGMSLKPWPLAKIGEPMRHLFCQLTIGSLVAV